jgi:[protein-PII] uridylyltransferase
MFENLIKTIDESKSFWSNKDFYQEKVDEQIKRHLQFNNTAYNLEPDIKNGPGSLRDLHTIFWLCKKFLGIDKIEELLNHNILTEKQLQQLINSRNFLSLIRYSLHSETKRAENRLLFEYQKKLAKQLNYEDQDHLIGVEIFMQDYYKSARTISRMNEIILQTLKQQFLEKSDKKAKDINQNFQIKNQLVGIKDGISFKDKPALLLEIFLLFQKNKDVEGIDAKTIGLITNNLHLINKDFRRKIEHKEIFLEILKAPEGVTHELRRMNLYGVLGHYIPAFGLIEGRMQYDLFHAFTVDEHTLFVVSNLRRLALTRFNHEFPEDSQKMQAIESPEILYIAGLFHDIAKGRGGDHSIIGAEEAEVFCLDHGLTNYDSKVVSWLVMNHLVFSLTAQKKDIYDPNVIRDLALLIGDELRLDYLYLLTVCDVRATNPTLWNSWKKRLFDDLYLLTKKALREGLEEPIDKEELIREKISLTKNELNNHEFQNVENFLSYFDDDYFIKFNMNEILKQSLVMINRNIPNKAQDIIDISAIDNEDYFYAFVFTQIDNESFYKITSIFEQEGVSVRDAKVVRVNEEYCIYSFYFDHMRTMKDEINQKNETINKCINKAMASDSFSAQSGSQILSRRLRSFDKKVDISFSEDLIHNRTVMEITCIDRPGLLSNISKIFKEESIWIQSAKIATIGEKADDIFYLNNSKKECIDQSIYESLKTKINDSLKVS